MQPGFFDALVDELSNISSLNDLPEWIPCTDSDILRDLPIMVERRKWLRKAKAEITRRKIQERVDEIAEARESEDQLAVEVLVKAFPEDLKLHKNLTPAQRQMWIDKASLAACGRSNEMAAREPIIYFIACGDDLIKIGTLRTCARVSARSEQLPLKTSACCSLFRARAMMNKNYTASLRPTGPDVSGSLDATP